MIKKIMSQNGAIQSEQQTKNSSVNCSTDCSDNSNKEKTQIYIKTVNKFIYLTPITKKIGIKNIPKPPKKKKRIKEDIYLVNVGKNLLDIFKTM